MRASETFDVVVVGGGPAGSAAALTLARAGRRVLLAETVSQVPFKIGETLPPAAQPLLRDLGVAERVAGHLPCPGIVAAWGGEQAVERDFIHDVHGPGWHLDRPRFDADLRAAAAEAGAEVRLECALSRWQRAGAYGGWQLCFARREEAFPVITPWIVDATGRRALLARHYGGEGDEDDALVAFCVNAPADGANADARTFIEATPEGWWYSARLPAGRRIVAFFTDGDLPAAAECAAASGWMRRLDATRYIGRTIGALSWGEIDRVRRFPAGSRSRRQFDGPGWLAVGDASLAFDPLSSQGMFHALYTGLRGAQTVMAAQAGDRNALHAWDERLRAIQAAYRQHRAQYYAAEQRWLDEPFWQRRHSRLRFGAASAESAVEPVAVG